VCRQAGLARRGPWRRPHLSSLWLLELSLIYDFGHKREELREEEQQRENTGTLQT
jgi:hypothetical protein